MAEEKLRFLADASILLAGSLDTGETLRQLAHAIVPRFADWCTIALRGEDDVIRRIVGVHKDPARQPAMKEYLRGYDPGDHKGSVITDAIAHGKSFFAQHVEPQQLEAAAQTPEHLRILMTLGCTSSIIVPLIARGTPIGALSLCMCDGTREFTEVDHQLARELGALAGLCVDSARRFADERMARWRAERAEAETRALLTERQELLQKAEAASRAKDEFLAILGHELRNPLAPIVTALELMKAHGGAPQRELAVIERQTRHLVRLVDDLLDVSRIARGLVALERQPVSAREVVDKAIEMAEPMLAERALTIDVPEELVIDADPMRLAQAVANLLTNACKYTKAGGAVGISASANENEISITVRDDGVGIDPMMLPRVFDMFVQERQALDRSRGGLGLGLTIVKSLVEAHGGSVTAHSGGKDQGSEFQIRVPTATMQPPVHRPDVREEPTAATGMRVLVVDDNEDAAVLMAESLSRRGYVTKTASDAREAMAVAKTFNPQAAVLDIGLPVVDGYQLARQLRMLPGFERIYLIALTGYGQGVDRERALAAGFDQHLVKPVEVAKIRALLDAALAANRAR